MRHKSGPYGTAEKHVKDIRRATRKQNSAEEKIRFVLEDLRGKYSIAELCRREGIAQRPLLQVVEGVSRSRQKASVYRLLKALDLITSEAFTIVKAANEFKDKTTAPNQLWQTSFT